MRLIRVFTLGVFAGYLIWSEQGKQLVHNLRSAADRLAAARSAREQPDYVPAPAGGTTLRDMGRPLDEASGASRTVAFG